MGDVSQVTATIQKTLELASRCTQLETSENYGALGDQVEELEAQAREAFRSKMDVGSLLPKLKAAKPLTPDDLKTSDLDVDRLMHLRALCAEVRRVLPDVVYYLDQKERSAKFEEATRKPLDPEGYRVLAEIIEQMR
jgi:hypothetical protein